MWISKPYGGFKPQKFRTQSSVRAPSRKFVQAVEQALSSAYPIVTRICNTQGALTASDPYQVITQRQQSIFQIYRLNSGAAFAASSDSTETFANQFCAYFNLADLSTVPTDRTLHFIDVNNETVFTNMANTTITLDLWFVFPRHDTPTASLTTAGAASASIFVSPYSTILTQGLTAPLDSPLAGPVGDADVVPTINMIGVTPYDSRLFCQHFRLGKKQTRQLEPSANFTLRHGMEWNKNLAISEFFDAVSDEYISMDMEGMTYGILARARCQHVSAVADPEAPDYSVATGNTGFGGGKLTWHTTARWRFHQCDATGQNNPAVTSDAVTVTALSNENVTGPGISGSSAVEYS